ncbi:DarT ssDNA thymidine ADP-ribosyltransferase family protein [Janthinobacterium sp.]|uniref:DarT ssDNA thymidine ADP-ribosyltransferase family protein n=1 Tax=Janthinobacterium sp. TaxID=1871054 RepID=UPI00262C317A|nr:DarT ssDNA thymidine ADP-ribosyltransferase family protein [Janthinobacterium sp.]
MSVSDLAMKRGVDSLLHFTTNFGCLGVLATQSLKARQRLNEDQQLKHIFQPNAKFRTKDVAWLDYVNLSISKINTKFFATSSGSWHKEKDLWWCIFDFSIEILDHQDVWFTTTNNAYSGVHRQQGEAGFSALFAPKIEQWHSSVIHRESTLPSFQTTCFQAEVLYPGEISTKYLKKIHVSSDQYADELAGQIHAVTHRPISINVCPDMFEEIK